MPRFLDLTSMTFGYLTVERLVGKKYKGQSLWECRCACGRVVEVPVGPLRSGRTRSCGCIRGQDKVKDLVGQTFARLTVVRRDGSDKRGQAHWLCRCDCGKEVRVRGSALTSGNTKSCGCFWLDLTGKSFGRLIVLRWAGHEVERSSWVCHCACGNETVVRSDGLTSGSTQSCGCLKAEQTAAMGRERLIDLVGRTFGKLTVISRVGSITRKNGTIALWLCTCACGNQAQKTSGELLHNKIESCSIRCSVGHQDLVGQTFGRLTVLREHDVRSTHIKWVCLCACGNEAIASSSQLRFGRVKSCGCYRAEIGRENSAAAGRAKLNDLTGRIFGRLTVVERAPNDREFVRWKCLCECGSYHEVRAGSLRNGTVISCGCAKIDRPGLMARNVLDRSISAYHKRRANKTAAGGSFTEDEIKELYRKQRGKCAEPTCRASLKEGFDRDHIKPIALGGSSNIQNIQLLCPPCNRRKNRKDPLVWAREKGRLL